MKKKTLISWSSGKDSAWTLHVLKQDSSIEVTGLFTVINKKFNRIALHGIRSELLQEQAKQLNLPLYIIEIPHPCSNDDYVNAFKSFVVEAKKMNIHYFAFGDLFLREVRQYREDLLEGSGVFPLFPLWGIPTDTLSRDMIASGLKAVIACLDLKQLSVEFAGQEYDDTFLQKLSPHVDPCGENGEFHSFTYDGPIFQKPINIAVGTKTMRNGICFTDILSKQKE